MQNFYKLSLLAISLLVTTLIIAPSCSHVQENVEEENEGYDGPDKAIEFEIERTKDPATGKVPWDQFRLAIQQTDLAKDAARGAQNRINDLSWIERGPDGDFPGPNGNSRPSGQQTSGRIRAVMVDSLDPTHKTVFVGGVAGGLWKTSDITASPANWVLVNDLFDNLSVAAICQDPRPGFQNIMYMCTGESYGNADAVRGIGVFKSVDAGATWSFLSSSTSFIYGTRILCDYQGNVYLGTRNTGLLRSADGGTNWQNITPSGVANSVCDLEISSTATAARLHVVVGIGTGQTQAYRFTDIPATVTGTVGWTAPTTPFPSYTQRAEIAVSGNTLYALPANSSGQAPTVYKSIDGGVIWNAAGTTPTTYTGSPFTNSQGWYDLSVRINPNNPDECIIGGVDCAKTINGGTTWTRITAWAGSAGPYVHADQHDIQWWDGGSKLLFACDGGVHFSTNGGTTITDRNKGLRLKQFYSIAIHPTETNYFLAGAQDNGCHRLNHPGLDSSIEVTGGDGCYMAIDQDEPQYQFGSYVYNVFRRSINNGATWSTPVNDQSSGRFVNPWDYDNIGNKLYACSGNGNYMRWDDPQTGSTTSVVSIPEFSGQQVGAVYVSPYTANTVYFGTISGRVVKVDNANMAAPTATNITPAGSAGYVNCIVTGSNDQNLLAIYSSYGVMNVWVSTNGGTSWTGIDGNLPNMPVRWALFNPDTDSKAYIATETGVWETDLINGASTIWSANPSFPNVRTDMIKYRAGDRTIAAGTHGRGIWSATVPLPFGFTFNAPAAATATCPAPASMAITLGTIASGGFTNPITLSATGNPAGTTVSFSPNPVTPGNNTTVTLNGTAGLAAGSYVVTVSGTATGGGTQQRQLTYTINPGVGPAITTQPSNQAGCIGSNTNFSIASAGATSYQWQLSTNGGTNWTNISGATNNTLAVTSITAAMNSNQYRCQAMTTCGQSSSNAATLTVNIAPTITGNGQPQNVSICAGGNATFTIIANNATSYQWQVSTDGGTNYSNITGATAASYTQNSVTVAMDGNRYRCVASGGCSPAATSSSATLTTATSIAISSQPSNKTICEATNTSFSVSASGSGLVYQWQVSTNGGVTYSNVSNVGVYTGATTNMLTITNATASLHQNRYQVVITNPSCPTTTSQAAILTVNTFPQIGTQPINAVICEGANVSFNVAATTGTGSLSYQWQLSTNNGGTYNNISGATNSSLALTNVTAGANSYLYRVVVTAGCGSVNSSAAKLTVNTYPIINFTAPAVLCKSDPATSLSPTPSGGTLSGNGLSGSIFNPTTAGVGAASITYQVTNAGCISTVVRTIQVNECAERHLTLEQNGSAIIYPNPNPGLFKIKMNSDLYTKLDMKIFNAKGQVAATQQFTNLRYGTISSVDMTRLPAGTYRVLLTNNERGFSAKTVSIIIFK